MARVRAVPQGGVDTVPFRERIGETSILVGVLVVVLAILVIPPIWFLIQGSFLTTKIDGSPGDATLKYYGLLTSDPAFFRSAINSIVFAMGSAAVALVFGGVQAWIVERTNTPFKAIAYVGAIISLGIPYILYTIAWLFLLGRSGPVNAWYRALTGGTDALINVYSLGGMILIEGFLFSPLVFLMMSSTLRTANPEFEEAARVNGASIWQTLTRVTLRMSAPIILALAMLVFIRAIESFEVPALVGLPGKVTVLTTDIFLDIHKEIPPDFGHASAFSVVLLIVVGILLYFYNRLSKSATKYHTVTGKGFRARVIDLGGWRYLTLSILVVNFLLIIAVPFSILIWASFLPFYQPFKIAALKLLTLDNYRQVMDSPDYFAAMGDTLILAFGCATIATAITAVGGWLAVRRRPGAWMIDQLATMPLIFPGIVLGVAILQLYIYLPIPIYGTIWILMVAFVIRYLPYSMRYSYSGIMQIHGELEEVANVAGASPLMTFRRIIAPLMRPAIIAGWLFLFLLAARELSMAILLSSPNAQVVSVAIFDLWENGQATELAAFGLTWTAIMTCIAIGFYAFVRRAGISVYD